MSWWAKKARELLADVRGDEYEIGQVYEDDQVNRSIVHTREDMVLVVSYLNAVNHHLSQSRYLLIIIAVIMALGLWRIW